VEQDVALCDELDWKLSLHATQTRLLDAVGACCWYSPEVHILTDLHVVCPDKSWNSVEPLQLSQTRSLEVVAAFPSF
jgi:hypothetical protein